MKFRKIQSNQRGIVLMLTIITLVVLATMMYTLGSKLSSKIHRDKYVIDYQKARYACDSAAKYALAVIDESEFDLISRPNEPDFSDLYRMSQEEYDLLIEEYRQQLVEDVNSVFPGAEEFYDQQSQAQQPAVTDMNFADMINMAEMPSQEQMYNQSYEDFNDANDANQGYGYGFGFGGYDPFENLFVRGPYGYKWPHAQKPLEFEIGETEVMIEIHDENAKLPLTWALTTDPERTKQAKAAVESFFEWMGLSLFEIEKLREDFEQIQEVKDFSINMKPVKIVKKEVKEVRTSRRSRRSRRRRTTTRKKTVTTVSNRDDILHLTDFSKIMHGSELDDNILQQANIQAADRVENPYKYLGLWGTSKVNINTAPRHVLEAAFTYGGDEVEIAEAIIQMRKIKPFEDLEELADELYRYNDTIEESKPFLTTKSEVFTIHVTSYSGTAKASLVAAVKKTKDKVQRIAIFPDD